MVLFLYICNAFNRAVILYYVTRQSGSGRPVNANKMLPVGTTRFLSSDGNLEHIAQVWTETGILPDYGISLL